MSCQDGAGPCSGAGEDRSKQVTELRERILRLAGHDCHEEDEKSQTELMEDLNICKRDTLVELCHSFDIAGSRANRKDELVSFLMKFLKNNCSHTDAMVPIKVADLREQILQLAEHACLEEQEKSQTELLERLNVCKRDTLIELCRSFDIIGSRANRKDELVSFLMKFVKEHSSAIDDKNPDKKIKKRRRVNEEENLSSGKPLKKQKQEGTALGTQNEEEAHVRNVDSRNYYESDAKDSRYSCADNKNGEFANDKANLEPTLVTTAEVDNFYMKASEKKYSSVTKKKATPKSDHKVKSCGKSGSKGDMNPRKQAMKPSRDELRKAIVLILDSTDFATMTFGDVIKEVDKYFQKDLFERKPLIRSLIEEELFRLSEEAEKKELEEEVAEAKARAEQSTKEMAQVQTMETGINKPDNYIAGQNRKTKGCGNSNENGINGGSSVRRNSSDTAGGSQNGKADAGIKIGENEASNDGKCENVDVGIQDSTNGEVEIANVIHNTIDTQENSEDGRTKEPCNGDHDDTEYGRTGGSENDSNNAEDINVSEAKQSKNLADDERIKHVEDGNAKKASNEKSSSVAIHGDKDGKEKEGNVDAEENPTDSGSDGKAEDTIHNVTTKVDAGWCSF